MAVAIAAFFYFYNEKTIDNLIDEPESNQMKRANTPVAESEFIPDSATVGTLVLKISFTNLETPAKLEGKLDLVKLNNDETEELRKLYNISALSLSCEYLSPGRYRIESEINIPDAEYKFIAKPEIIEISAGEIVRHNILIKN